MVFRASYPSTKLESVAAKCLETGIDAKPPTDAPQFDYIIVGGTINAR
jgi:hypothetical protein